MSGSSHYTDSQLRKFPELLEDSRWDPIATHRGSASAVSARTNTSSSGLDSGPVHDKQHQRFVVADPLAFRFLEEDRLTTVLERSTWLRGYQCYVIEQWACSRAHPTFVIVAHTGDPAHKIRVGILGVPSDENDWTARLKAYFKALARYHAKRRDTPLGALMVTNLSGFPSSLTSILVPNGDIRTQRDFFFVNENLKRMGCSGRVGLSLTEPSPPTQAKFQHLYRTSSKIPFMASVIELVKLCQIALMLFACLEPDYCDGLLCDVTEKAISDFWAKIGTDLYNVEPSDGVIGPTTVAALLGTLVGCRNRLHAVGAPVAKDAFDVESTKRAVAYFQKTQQMPKTRRLDRHTIDRLQRATAKQASGDGWTVPKAVKSTVADLSGKGGEMVMDMVGRKEKASISEIETVDLERFADLVRGDIGKWLWHGKPRSHSNRHGFFHDNHRHDEPQRSQTQDSGQGEVGDVSDDNEKEHNKAMEYTNNHLLSAEERVRERQDGHMPGTIFKRAKGRIKGAVGLRGHNYNSSTDVPSLYTVGDRKSMESIESPAESTPNSPQNGDTRQEYFSQEQKRRQMNLSRLQSAHPRYAGEITETPIDASRDLLLPQSKRDSSFGPPIEFGDDLSRTVTRRSSIAESVSKSIDANLPPDRRPGQNVGRLLRYRQSYPDFRRALLRKRADDYWPRHVSFSAAEDILYRSSASLAEPEEGDLSRTGSTNPRKELLIERRHADKARRLRNDLAIVGAGPAMWVESKISQVFDLDNFASEQVDHLEAILRPRKDQFSALEEAAHEIIEREKLQLQEAIKDVETLGAKLEYEIGALKGKVEEVQDAVDEFETQIDYTEGRVQELFDVSNQESWIHWVCRLTTGIGTKPEKIKLDELIN